MEKLKEKFIIDKSGKKTAIILPIKDYKELLEDIHDLAVIAERKEESTISFDKLKIRLKNDGLI
jgi:phosphoglucomutase